MFILFSLNFYNLLIKLLKKIGLPISKSEGILDLPKMITFLFEIIEELSVSIDPYIRFFGFIVLNFIGIILRHILSYCYLGVIISYNTYVLIFIIDVINNDIYYLNS